MDLNLWDSILRTRESEAEGVQDFVKQTYSRVELICNGLPERIISLYSLAASRLYSLKGQDDFEKWIEGLLPLALKEESTYSGLNAEDPRKTAELAVAKYVSRPVTASINEMFTRLTLSGWLPAFGISLPILIASVSGDTWLTNLIPFFLLLFVIPTIFSAVFGPLLGWWRQIHSPHSWRNIPISILFTCAFYCFLNITLVAGIYLFARSDFEALWHDFSSAFLFGIPLEALSHKWTSVPGGKFVVSLLILSVPWLCKVFASVQPWVVNRSGRPWRKGLARLFLIPIVLSYAVSTVGAVGKFTIDESLREATDRAIATSRVEEKKEEVAPDQSLAKLLFADKRYLEFKQSETQSTSLSAKQKERVFQAWLEAGNELWGQENWRDSAAFKGLAGEFPEVSQDEQRTELISFAEIESRLRMTSYSREVALPGLIEALANLQTTRTKWNRLHDLLLIEARLAQADSISFEAWTESYFTFQVAVNEAPDRDDGPLKRALENLRLNTDWRRFQAHRELLLDSRPLTCEDYKTLGADVQMSGPLEMKFIRDISSMRLLGAILVTEVKQRKLEGSAVPASLSDFSVAAQELVGPYHEWLAYRRTVDRVDIGILDCPHLPSYFRGPRNVSIVL